MNINDKKTDYELEEKDLFCEKHNHAYKGFSVGFITSICPICKKEQEEQKIKIEQAQEQAKIKEELERQDRFLREYSKIPQKYLYFNADYTSPNFAKYQKILSEPLKRNLFIYGDVGVGKTLFLSELMKANKHRYPKYLSGNDIILTNENSYKLDEFLEYYKYTKLLIIDEVQKVLFSDKIHLLDIIIDNAYQNDAIIVFCGNFTQESVSVLTQDKFKRITSRIKQNNLKALFFGGGDLRQQGASNENEL